MVYSTKRFIFVLYSEGKCPVPVPGPECPAIPESLCSVDSECPGDLKCCDDGCLGFQCVGPGRLFNETLVVAT